MPGGDEKTGAPFSHLSPEAPIPQGHPLPAIRPLVTRALERLSTQLVAVYPPVWRASPRA